ncbi:hypothetical protein [Bacillus mycoides]
MKARKLYGAVAWRRLRVILTLEGEIFSICFFIALYLIWELWGGFNKT